MKSIFLYFYLTGPGGGGLRPVSSLRVRWLTRVLTTAGQTNFTSEEPHRQIHARTLQEATTLVKVKKVWCKQLIITLLDMRGRTFKFHHLEAAQCRDTESREFLCILHVCSSHCCLILYAMNPWRFVYRYQSFGEFRCFYPRGSPRKSGGTKILQNLRTCIPIYTVSNTIRLKSW